MESVFGIIYPPQVALVGFGRIAKRPWLSDGQMVVRPVITATLSGDHRVSDGHRGGVFLSACTDGFRNRRSYDQERNPSHLFFMSWAGSRRKLTWHSSSRI